MDYSAKIKHDEKTILEMAKAQNACFKPKTAIYLSVVSLAILAVAVFVPGLNQVARGLLVAMGCFTLVGLNAAPGRLAKQVIASLGGKFPEIYYFFYEDGRKRTGAEVSEQKYGEIIRLVEQRNYLFLFLENHSAYMIDKKSARPDPDSLKSFLSLKTGCGWSRPGGKPLMEYLKFERVKTRL